MQTFPATISLYELTEFVEDQEASLDAYRIVELLSLDPEDLWPDEMPALFVHRGTVSLQGPVVCSADQGAAIYVIDGDLQVDGPLVLERLTNEVLLVTGNLHCSDLFAGIDLHLFVLGNVTVDGLAFFSFSDQGSCKLLGEYTARHSAVGLHMTPEFKCPPASDSVSGASYSDIEGNAYQPSGSLPAFSEAMHKRLKLDQGEDTLDLGWIGMALLEGLPLY